MYRVLVAVNEDHKRASRLIDAVVSLADATEELRVVVVHVFREIEVPRQVSVHQPTSDYEELLDDLREAPPTIQQVVDGIEAAGVDVEIRIVAGDPAQKILELAEESDSEDIYIGGRKHSPTGKVLFGSTTQAVLLNAETPVTVVGSSDE